MTPLVKRNVETLADICGEKAATGKSFDFYKWVKLVNQIRDTYYSTVINDIIKFQLMQLDHSSTIDFFD